MRFRKVHQAKLLNTVFYSIVACSLMAFKDRDGLRQLAEQTVIKLTSFCQSNGDKVKLKKYDLVINEEGFFRYRKYLVNGKQEYYSFNVLRLKDLDYMGTSVSGTLVLRTRSEDVIVQTYNDPKGNVDSMAYQVELPVNGIEAEDLHAIRENLLKIRRELE